MTKYIMERKAEDNKYLHKDFHLTPDLGIAYVGENYGDLAVEKYLTQYAKSFYKPHIEEMKKDGLIAFKNYLEKIYKAEECEDALEINLENNILKVGIKYCPAVKYMLSVGHKPSKWYKQTVSLCYAVVAKESGYNFKLISYDEKNGSCEFIMGDNI